MSSRTVIGAMTLTDDERRVSHGKTRDRIIKEPLGDGKCLIEGLLE